MANIQQKTNPTPAFAAMLKADSVQAQFKNALGKHSDSFVASLIDLYSTDSQLQTCKPEEVVKQALKAASLQLPINKALGFAYIYVFNNNVKTKDERGMDVWTKVPTPTFVPGYRGYIQLAMRTGQYRNINADVVYEGEMRKVNKLTGEVAFDGEKTSEKVVGYFCYFELLNGFSKTLYMSVEQMASYALRFAPSLPKGTTKELLMKKAQENGNEKGVGWTNNFTAMAMKTVIRQLLGKYGYLSVEMQDGIESDRTAEEHSDGAFVETTTAEVIEEPQAIEEISSSAAPEAVNAAPADGPDY